MLVVDLEPEQLAFAVDVGERRAAQNLALGRKSKWGGPNDPEASRLVHIAGAKGEMAASVALRIPWTEPVGVWGVVDLDGVVEVRSCDQIHHKLILHPEDRAEVPFVLACVPQKEIALARVPLLGWTFADHANGKQTRFWADPKGDRPAYFVPQRKLYRLDMIEHFIVRSDRRGAEAPR